MNKTKLQAEFKLEDVWAASNSIMAFTNENKLDLKLGWAFEDIVDAFEKHVKRYSSERDSLLAIHGNKILTEDGKFTGRYDLKDQDKFAKDAEKLGNTLVTIEFYPIPLADIENAKLKMNGQELRPMRRIGVIEMIKEEESENGKGKARDAKTSVKKTSESELVAE